MCLAHMEATTLSHESLFFSPDPRAPSAPILPGSFVAFLS